MHIPTLTVMMGSQQLFRQMPGGVVMLPLKTSERQAAVKALREALSLFEEFSQPCGATESG